MYAFAYSLGLTLASSDLSSSPDQKTVCLIASYTNELEWQLSGKVLQGMAGAILKDNPLRNIWSPRLGDDHSVYIESVKKSPCSPTDQTIYVKTRYQKRLDFMSASVSDPTAGWSQKTEHPYLKNDLVKVRFLRLEGPTASTEQARLDRLAEEDGKTLYYKIKHLHYFL